MNIKYLSRALWRVASGSSTPPTIPIPPRTQTPHRPTNFAKSSYQLAQSNKFYHSAEFGRTDVYDSATEPSLSQEQKELVDLILSGKNVFYTGSAGTGKSTVLKTFVREMNSNGKRVRVVAPTGRVALDINGSTTWTFAGWTPDDMKKPLEELLNVKRNKSATKKTLEQVLNTKRYKSAMKRLRNTDTLVIDEISMVENNHFERLNLLMQKARKSKKAFGGAQLVVTGDFCQLPPVKPFQFCFSCGKELRADKFALTYTCPDHGLFRDEDKWAFRSKVWAKCKFKHVNLKTIHRQHDETFIKILNKCRLGTRFSPEENDILINHEHSTENAVRLFSTREEVRQVNQSEFKRLKTQQVSYDAVDNFLWNPEHEHIASKDSRRPDGTLRALAEHRFDPKVHIKVGMLVVLLVNISIKDGLVNGSQGVVTGFESFGWTDMDEIIRRGKVGEDHHYLEFKQQNVAEFIDQAPEKLWPIVEFDNGIKMPIFCDCAINELGDEKPYSLISRVQVPLLPAWAMSIHKSQGMTLNKVVVDLSRSFEHGQMYVALSRARSLEGLKVIGLSSSIHSDGNPEVKEFLEKNFDLD